MYFAAQMNSPPAIYLSVPCCTALCLPAHLPACRALQEINSIVCRSGESVKEELKRSLYGSVSQSCSDGCQ